MWRHNDVSLEDLYYDLCQNSSLRLSKWLYILKTYPCLQFAQIWLLWEFSENSLLWFSLWNFSSLLWNFTRKSTCCKWQSTFRRRGAPDHQFELFGQFHGQPIKSLQWLKSLKSERTWHLLKILLLSKGTLQIFLQLWNLWKRSKDV